MKDGRLIIQPKKYREVTSVVSARLPNDMIRALDRAAERTGHKRNEIIAICLEFAVERMEFGEEEKSGEKKGGRK